MARSGGNNDVAAVLKQVGKFTTYSPGGSSLFDLVVVYSDNKGRTGGEV